MTSYIHDCLRFIRDDLNFKTHPAYGTLMSTSGSKRFDRLIADLNTTLSALGVKAYAATSPSWQTRRRAVHSKLFNEGME